MVVVAGCRVPEFSNEVHALPFVIPAEAGTHEAHRKCGVTVGAQVADTVLVFNTELVETLVGPGLRRDDELIYY